MADVAADAGSARPKSRPNPAGRQAPPWLRRLGARVAENPDLAFKPLRALAPVLVFKSWPWPKRLRGWGVVSRFDDLREVLSHDWVFQTPYGPKMIEMNDGPSNMLGMTETPTYTRDRSNMSIVMRREDVPVRVAPMIEAAAEEAVARAGGRIDVVSELFRGMPCRVVSEYFGVPLDDPMAFADLANACSKYAFGDPFDDPKNREDALLAAPLMRVRIEAAFAAERASPSGRDTVVSRAIRLADVGQPGCDDRYMAANVLGMITGFVPTNSIAGTQAFAVLMSKPEALRGAQGAALADDDEMLLRYVLEALRFDPIDYGRFRNVAEDYTLRRVHIPKGTKLLVSNRSAMMDGRVLDRPREFRIDRPAHHYVHYGFGLHTCIGQWISNAQLPLSMKPLLKRRNLRIAPGGELQKKGPYPARMIVDYDWP